MYIQSISTYIAKDQIFAIQHWVFTGFSLGIYIHLSCGFPMFVIFTPDPWEKFPFWPAYFSNGLTQQPTSISFKPCFFLYSRSFLQTWILQTWQLRVREYRLGSNMCFESLLETNSELPLKICFPLKEWDSYWQLHQLPNFLGGELLVLGEQLDLCVFLFRQEFCWNKFLKKSVWGWSNIPENELMSPKKGATLKRNFHLKQPSICGGIC